MPRQKIKTRRALSKSKRTRAKQPRLHLSWLWLAPLLGVALYFGYGYLRSQLFVPSSINLLREEGEDGVVITMTEKETNVTVTNEKTGKKVKVTPKPGQSVTDAIIDATKKVSQTNPPPNSNPDTKLPTTSHRCQAKGVNYEWDSTTNTCLYVGNIVSQTGPTTPATGDPADDSQEPNGPESSSQGGSCKVNDEDPVAYGDNQWVQLGNGVCRQCQSGNFDKITDTTCGTGEATSYVTTQDQIDNGAPTNCSKTVNGVTTYYSGTTVLDGTQVCDTGGKFVAKEEYVPPSLPQPGVTTTTQNGTTTTTTTTTNPTTGATTVTSVATNSTTGATTTTTTTYLQTDDQWASTTMATLECGGKSWTATLANAGCGPTAVTNTANRLGGTNLTPDQTFNQYYGSGNIVCGGTGASSNVSALDKLGYDTAPVVNYLPNVPANAGEGSTIFMGVNQGSDFEHWTTTDNWQTTGSTTTFEMHDSYFQDGDYNCTVTGAENFSCVGMTNGNTVNLSTANENLYKVTPSL